MLRTIILSIVLFSSVFGSQIDLARKRAVSDLDFIHSVFEVKYAPLQWKKEFASWDLKKQIQHAKGRVKKAKAPEAFRTIFKDFFNSARDYHVGVRFYSTESASLPFLIKGAQGRYFIAYVNESKFAPGQFPFEVGDEIVEFDGRPVHEVICELREQEFGHNTLETDQALAELTLTSRKGESGHLIPRGNVSVAGRKRGEEELREVTLKWAYTPERIRGFSKLGEKYECQFDTLGFSSDEPNLRHHPFFEKMLITPLWDKSYVGGSFDVAHNHSLGARTSFLPPLGRKLWKSDRTDFFDAYIFKTQSGKRIGYVRIPHYVGGEEETEEFCDIIDFFEDVTDAMIIDQLNNPGGSLFYLYSLLATLTDKPLCSPKHHIAMTQDEVYTAVTLLPMLQDIDDDETARFVMGDTLGGYPVDYGVIKLMRGFCNFLISEWNEGKLYTDATYIFGVDEIHPHPHCHYTKPILVLTNSLDFSGGDFFPAIMQDNKRATIMGTRTAGAGGYVTTTEFPNQSGIRDFLLTGSLAERKNKRPIENLGVKPDIQYEVSQRDLEYNYCEYVLAIIDEIEKLVRR